MTTNAEARARSIEWARNVVSEDRAVVIDTETTGLGDDAEICDIGIVALDGTVFCNRLVRPSKPIPPGASAVHGISDAMVADAPTWPELYAFVAESIAPVVIVYNRDYDLGVINRLNARYGLPEFGKHERWDCALRAFSDFKGDPGKFPGSYKWHKLDDAAAHFGIPPGGHRALADAETARKVVLAMAAAGEAPTDPQDDLKEARRHLARRRGLLS